MESSVDDYQTTNVTGNIIFNTGKLFSSDKVQNFEVFSFTEQFIEVEAPSTSAVYVDVKYELQSWSLCLSLGEAS